MPIFNFSHRKVGGLHFVRIGRFGFSFYVSRPCRRYEGGNVIEVTANQ